MARNGSVTVGTTEIDVFRSSSLAGADGPRAFKIIIRNNAGNTAGTIANVRCPSLGHEAAAYWPLALGEAITFETPPGHQPSLENVRVVCTAAAQSVLISVTA